MVVEKAVERNNNDIRIRNTFQSTQLSTKRDCILTACTIIGMLGLWYHTRVTDRADTFWVLDKLLFNRLLHVRH